MNTHRGRTRRYSEKDVGILIQRATELQQEGSHASERGLSLREIEHIADEMGIAPEHLRAAAMELDSRLEPGGAFRLWGGPFRVDHQRTVDGAVTEARWAHIVQELRRVTGSEGRTREVGPSREWTRAVKDLNYVIERTSVTLHPEGDQTTIEVRKHYKGGALMAYFLSAVIGGTVAGIGLDGGGLPDLMNALIVGGSGLGGLAVVRASLAYWTSRQRQKVARLMDWLHDAVASPESVEREERPLADAPERSDGENASSASGASRNRLRT